MGSVYQKRGYLFSHLQMIVLPRFRMDVIIRRKKCKMLSKCLKRGKACKCHKGGLRSIAYLQKSININYCLNAK